MRDGTVRVGMLSIPRTLRRRGRGNAFGTAHGSTCYKGGHRPISFLFSRTNKCEADKGERETNIIFYCVSPPNLLETMASIPIHLSFVAKYPSIIWVIPTIFLVYKILTFGSREKHLPPGPPTVPILGNAHLIPSKGFYSKWVVSLKNYPVYSLTGLRLKEWGDQYGSVYSLKVGQSTMVVLNDRRAVYELLNQKGAWYNDRPVDQHILFSARNENIALMHEGPKWRAERKIAASYFAPKKLDSDLKLVQEAEYARAQWRRSVWSSWVLM